MNDFLVTSSVLAGHVGVLEFSRPPHNHFDEPIVSAIANEMEAMAGSDCRVIVLCSEGKHFCAGANLAANDPGRGSADVPHLYDAALRMLEQPLPVVAAVQGGAIGGGLGLAMVCDFRVATPGTRFAASFARLGVHQGFGLSLTLPLVVGHQRSLDMLYTGRRVAGEEALTMSLCDRLVPAKDLRQGAIDLAREVALGAPLALRSIRKTMRQDLILGFRDMTDHEKREQIALMATDDHVEGIRASAERRPPTFVGS